jgi:hypothetical protein
MPSYRGNFCFYPNLAKLKTKKNYLKQAKDRKIFIFFVTSMICSKHPINNPKIRAKIMFKIFIRIGDTLDSETKK